ncbi:MAG TPA: hypothetical protein VFX51_22095 [Solirubrobacteraceae bacterium]|nr:hypothetical protein [Solirubrobacteraceae bacterium]
MALTLVAFIAAGFQVMSFTATAATDDEAFTGMAERRVVPHPPTAASDGLPVPALVGGIVLAFAVGIAGGQVHRRRRVAHRRIVASARPGPVLTPPAQPVPEPPAAEPRIDPRPVDLAPAAPAAPAPAPPEAEVPAEQPVDLSGAPRPLPAPPPPEPRAAPPRVVETPAAPTPAVPEPPQRETPQTERPSEPLRLLQRGAPRPAADAPRGETADAPQPEADAPRDETADAPQPEADASLGEAPEVPRLEQPPAEEPAIPLESAPETVLTPASEAPAPAPAPAEVPAPVRRFARPAPWPEDAHELWTCEIAWKAGYRKSSFRAMAGPPGDGKRRPIGDSPSMRWSLMGEPEPPTPELAIRVRILVDALETAGWEHIGRGQRWYAQRFVWRGSDEPRPVDIPDVEPAER